MKTLFAFIIVMGLAASTVAYAADGVKWTTLKAGMERAKTEKKPVIVDFFYGKGCPRCEFLQKEIYDNPAIAKKIMEDFIPILIDLTKNLTKEEEDLGKKYDYKDDCLLLFLDPKGDLFTDSSGKKLCFIDKVDPEEFIGYLDMIRKKSAR